LDKNANKYIKKSTTTMKMIKVCKILIISTKNLTSSISYEAKNQIHLTQLHNVKIKKHEIS